MTAPRTSTWRLVVAALAFVAATLATGVRIWSVRNVPGEPARPRPGLIDFRDATYYPAIALLAGENPYDEDSYRARFPVGARFPLYAPATPLLHAPLALLPVETAELLWLVLGIVLTVMLARVSVVGAGWKPEAWRVLAVATALVLSRPGQQNLFLGQHAATLALAVSVAWLWRRRPCLAGLALAVSTIKPTTGIPLAALLLAAGAWRAVAIAVGVAGFVNAVALVLLARAAGGAGPLLASFLKNYRRFGSGAWVDPVTSPSRVDVVPLIARWLGQVPGGAVELGLTLATLAVGCVAVRGLAVQDGGHDERSSERHVLALTIVCATILACTYHQPYDLLFLSAPLAAVAAARRWTLLACLAVPMANYLATDTVLSTLSRDGWERRLITSVNGAALVAIVVIAAYAARRASVGAAGRSARAPHRWSASQ